MNVHVLPAGPIRTNAYLLTESARGEAVLIDAPEGIADDIAPILEREKCRLTELWLTHGHWDHMQGGAELLQRTAAKVSAHLADRMMIETPQMMERFMGERLNLQPVLVDRWIKHGETFDVLGTTVEIRHVPGHCPGNVLFYFKSLGAAFVGDTLFNGGIGRTDFPGCSFEELERSIREQIYTLPGETVVLPGHGPTTTVAEERANNPYVSG